MADERKPTQAMPPPEAGDERPRPTQPTDEHKKHPPKKDDEDFGGFMGTGGQSVFGYDGPKPPDGGENPNSAADED
jgi:hypothetical protein